MEYSRLLQYPNHPISMGVCIHVYKSLVLDIVSCIYPINASAAPPHPSAIPIHVYSPRLHLTLVPPPRPLVRSFHRLSLTYGPVVNTYLPMGIPLVVLSGDEAIRGAFVTNSDCFSNRPQFIPTEKFIGLKGYISSSSSRRFIY